jgi:hypothetical protein
MEGFQMRLLSNNRRPLAAVLPIAYLLAAGCGGAFGSTVPLDRASEAAAGGSVSVSPGIFEHVAARGVAGTIEVSNTTTVTMTVTVTLRPWLQARSGEVSPNRRASLGGVGLSARSFTLSSGAKRKLSLTLASVPAHGSLYGAIEVVSVPHGEARPGVKLAYRVVSSLRLVAPKRVQRFSATAGSLIVQGSIGHGTLLLAMRNTGNTILPIGGKVVISGNGNSLGATAQEKAIVPGATVNLPLSQLPGSLPRGRYTVVARLSQGGHALGTIRRTINLH